MRLTTIFLFFYTFLLLQSCTKVSKEDTNNSKVIKKLEIGYAKGFTVDYYPDYKLVRILESGFANKQVIEYALIERGTPKPKNLPANAIPIEIPLQSIVCLSTTYAPMLDEIGEIDKIVGFADSKYSSLKSLQNQVKNGKIQEVGGQNGVTNTETIIQLEANAIMTYSEKDYEKLTKLGQKVIVNTEYLENSPLGRAEWIKLVAVFFNKEEIASKFFADVENNYQTTKKEIAATTKNMPAQQKPTIFGTIPYGNIWYMPAGKSFAATIWQDAGAEYAWQTTEGVGSLQISIEEVIAKAQKTTIWVNTGAFTSLQELIASDNRFANFLAVQKKQVYNCNKRVGEGGGNEFYEYGVIRPDIVLKDLARILYPNIYPNYELYFYQKLE